MIVICPSCDHEEVLGALFCTECGTKLVDEGGIITAAIKTKESEEKIQMQTAPIETSMDATVSLHIIRTGQILPLIGRSEFTLGRISEGQSILPDLDLTPYEAYNQGVSRLHATIRVNQQNLSIMDLGSSNGTRVNDIKVAPHDEFALKHGDVITLGQFRIQTLVRKD